MLEFKSLFSNGHLMMFYADSWTEACVASLVELFQIGI